MPGIGLRLTPRRRALSALLTLAFGCAVGDDAAAAASKPKNTSPPTISGAATTGQPLTAAPGTWTGTQPITYAYEWQRCNPDGGGCKTIAGADQPQYVPLSADFGRRLKVRVLATNSGGTGSATSAATAVVQAPAVAPSNTAPPMVTGPAREGETLSSTTGSWSGTEPISYSYQWQRCSIVCGDVPGATSAGYVAGANDVGSRLRVRVTATNAAGSSPATSAETGVVEALPVAPSNTAAPMISGEAREGATLSSTTGSWSGTEPISYGHQWQRCSPACDDVVGATDATYVATADDVGFRLRVQVTATNVAGSTSATSAETAVVQRRPVAMATALMSFDAAVDTYVDASAPDTSFGDSTSLLVDASPVKQTLLRFDVSGLDGRRVTGVRLRMQQKGSSPVGGAVHLVSSTEWSGSVTWNTRPALEEDLLGSFGAVSAGIYDIELDDLPVDDGPLALAIDSTSATGAQWGSIEGTATAVPRLILEVESPIGTVTDGISQVVGSLRGSSDPTFFAANHRLAVTAGGRMLAVHGRHASGVQLAWRDPAGNWQTQTSGDAPDGGVVSGTGTGDWPASIAVARDSTGSEHAWVVAGAVSAAALGSVYIHRLSDLDSPDGPRMGPLVLVDAPAGGAFKPDIQFERLADGTTRGLVVWARAAATGYETVVGAFTDLDTDTPAIAPAVLESGASSNRWGTLVPDRGMSVILRSNNRLVAYHHAADAPPGSWTHGASGLTVVPPAAATALATGALLAAAETDTVNHVVSVQRFAASGNAQDPPELQLSGYASPSIVSDGSDAWLLMIRVSDGFLVSRHYTGAAGWSPVDRVELGAEGGGNSNFPSALAPIDGRLRTIVRGPAASASRSAVLAVQRPL